MNDDTGAPSSLPQPRRLPWLAERLQQQSEIDTAGVNTSEPQQGQKKHGRRIGFLGDLIRQIDLVVDVHIVLLCYLDCSIGRLLLRLLPQKILASSPQMAFLASTLSTRPNIFYIILINAVCAFSHLAWDPPGGSELSRGYVHGGLLIDFVGEPAPASRWRMLFLDLCIFLLQLLQLATILEQRKVMLSGTDSGLLGALSRLAGGTSTQDVDAEEQGIRRSQELAQVGEEDEEDEENAVDDPLASSNRLHDESYDGRMMIMTVNPVRLFSKAWRRRTNASSQESREC